MGTSASVDQRREVVRRSCIRDIVFGDPLSQRNSNIMREIIQVSQDQQKMYLQVAVGFHQRTVDVASGPGYLKAKIYISDFPIFRSPKKTLFIEYHNHCFIVSVRTTAKYNPDKATGKVFQTFQNTLTCFESIPDSVIENPTWKIEKGIFTIELPKRAPKTISLSAPFTPLNI